MWQMCWLGLIAAGQSLKGPKVKSAFMILYTMCTDLFLAVYNLNGFSMLFVWQTGASKYIPDDNSVMYE